MDSNRWGEADIRENKYDGQGKNSCRGDLENVAYKVVEIQQNNFLKCVDKVDVVCYNRHMLRN